MRLLLCGVLLTGFLPCRLNEKALAYYHDAPDRYEHIGDPAG
ncbi:MAG TPA: hypothetical protein PKB07_27115 [Flavilitoribacter sp.]|nr:hypothetical protein [Flavilitoribacter sp.]